MKRVILLFGTLALLGALNACTSAGSGSGETAVTPPPPISATIPPGYSDTLPAGGNQSLGAPAAGAISGGPPTSVLSENQAFCNALQRTQSMFSGPDPGVDDATALQEMKDAFDNLGNIAPSGIKAEVQGMNDTIQALSSASDIDQLNDPDFTAEQERFASFVRQNCGFELAG
ncbi:MAG: hypothetical protein HYX32_05605 [Actinobacteria bacterium]|nr:hypothetical protein [Actinomycetota bacterium]